MSCHTSFPQNRLRFLLALAQPAASVSSVCKAFHISRPTFYKWRARFAAGGEAALTDRSHAPHVSPQRLQPRWRAELLALRQKHPRWGAKKLWHLLRREHPRTKSLPALRTLERWLKEAGLTVPPAPRARPGPQLTRPKLTLATKPNDVWTIDFKGWFIMGDGRRCEPLTVRDLASRYLLEVRVTNSISDRCVRQALRPVFRRFGLPKVLRVDNGTPFGGLGPLGLSTLSVWWRRLGIHVDFIRPAKPQDNGGHEQMHRILKADTASPPAANRRAQQRRFQAWVREFNTVRLHESLGGRRPADLYRPSRQPWHTPATEKYPSAWLTRKVLHKGAIKLHSRTRSIGRAFAGQTIGLKPADLRRYEIYLGTLHLGTLHLDDAGAMRPCVFKNPPPKWPARSGGGIPSPEGKV